MTDTPDTAAKVDGSDAGSTAAEPRPERPLPGHEIEIEAETEADTEDAAAAPSGGWRRPAIVALAVVAVVATALAVVMSIAAARLSGNDSLRGDRRDVARLSSRFGEDILTYDYRHLDQNQKDVLALSTGKFAREYRDANQRGLGEIIKGGKTISVASVAEVYVGDVENDTASAIVLVNSVQSGTGGRRPFQAYLDLDLVKVAGHWKVDDVTYISADQSGSSGSTTSTTAPGAGVTSSTAP